MYLSSSHENQGNFCFQSLWNFYTTQSASPRKILVLRWHWLPKKVQWICCGGNTLVLVHVRQWAYFILAVAICVKLFIHIHNFFAAILVQSHSLTGCESGWLTHWQSECCNSKSSHTAPPCTTLVPPLKKSECTARNQSFWTKVFYLKFDVFTYYIKIELLQKTFHLQILII